MHIPFYPAVLISDGHTGVPPAWPPNPFKCCDGAPTLRSYSLMASNVSILSINKAFRSATTRTYTTASRRNQTLSLHDGRILGYAEYGNRAGFPLLYFHGFPSSRLEASAVDQIARQRCLRVIAPDRPGYGLSTFQAGRRITDYPADTQSLVDHLGVSKFAVLGGSGGGPYALACAHSLPHERLSAVGVLAGAGPWAAGRQYVSTARRLLSLGAIYSPTALRVLIDGLVDTSRWCIRTGPATRWVDNWLEKQESQEESDLPTEDRRKMVLAMMFEAFAQGAAATVQEAGLLSHDWGFQFEDITYNNIRIWHGEKDTNSPIEMIRYMANRLPHCELREFQGDNHYTVARHIEKILAELVPEEVVQSHLARAS
ncbi:Alpha/Beta hydrolase protein [Aspergillus varians]